MEETTPPGIPSTETVDAAYQRLIEFGVVGAILAIILTVFLALIWWNLHQASKATARHHKQLEEQSDKHRKTIKRIADDHKEALIEQAEQHREERRQLVDDFKSRIESYSEVLKEKDAMLERIQEKRVEMAETAVAAITNVSHKLDQAISVWTDDA